MYSEVGYDVATREACAWRRALESRDSASSTMEGACDGRLRVRVPSLSLPSTVLTLDYRQKSALLRMISYTLLRKSLTFCWLVSLIS